MLGESDEFSEILKTGFPMYLLIAIPLLLVMSPVCPANAAHEFTVYRAQQYSLQGATYGKYQSVDCPSPCVSRLGDSDSIFFFSPDHRFKEQHNQLGGQIVENLEQSVQALCVCTDGQFHDGRV